MREWIVVATGLAFAPCRYGKPDDSGSHSGAPDSGAPDSLWDSPADSPVDTVTAATDTADTGDPQLPEAELLVLDQAHALILGHAWMVDCGHTLAGAGDYDADGLADIVIGDGGADWDNGGGGTTLLFSGASVSGTIDSLTEFDLRLVSLGYNEGGGAAVAAVGDVDGDGDDDIAMASHSSWYNGYDPLEGWLHLWWGPPDGGVTELVTSAADAQAELGSYGNPVLAGGGDVNGDGLRDLAAGMADHDDHDGGVAWVFTGPDLEAWATVSGGTGDECGAAVAMAGDVDGDGYDDVLIGAPQDGGASAPGATGMAGLVLGSATSLGELRLGTAHLRVVGESGALIATGYAVASVGDLEGDGRADLSIAATQVDRDEQWQGEEVALLLGSQAAAGGLVGLRDRAHARFVTTERGSSASRVSVAGPGDFEGDGLPDWLIGVQGHDADNGAAYVFLAAGLGIGGELGVEHANYVLTGDGAGGFGHSIAVAGDVNGDGADELLLGGPSYDTAGAVAVFGLLE